MEILSDPTPDMLAMPRFDDGAIDMQELLRRLAEQVVNAVMDAEADQLCGGGIRAGEPNKILISRNAQAFPHDGIEVPQTLGFDDDAEIQHVLNAHVGNRGYGDVSEKSSDGHSPKDAK